MACRAPSSSPTPLPLGPELTLKLHARPSMQTMQSTHSAQPRTHATCCVGPGAAGGCAMWNTCPRSALHRHHMQCSPRLARVCVTCTRSNTQEWRGWVCGPIGEPATQAIYPACGLVLHHTSRLQGQVNWIPMLYNIFSSWFLSIVYL